MASESSGGTIIGKIDGRDVHAFRLAAGDTTIEVIDYGAILTRVTRPDRNGVNADIVLGYDDPADYVTKPGNSGAICGRHSNRIANAHFDLDGKTYELTANTPPHHLHGGNPGFGKRFWTGRLDAAANAVVFTIDSPDGDQGYPGALVAEAIYTLTPDGDLRLEMRATTDKTTIVNLLYHGYWNLAGHGSGDVCGQMLQIEADATTAVSPDKIPTGEILPVAGTPLDFTSAKPIGQDIEAAWAGGGYDHNLCLKDQSGAMRVVARAHDPASGRGFVLSSNQPGLQLYTANHFKDNPVDGKDGARYERFGGFALETQVYPNGPNIPGFPSSRLEPGETYSHVMQFAFSSDAS